MADMEMGDIKFRGETYTWANNRDGEGFMQERLDRFCGSTDWMLRYYSVEVKHVLKQVSNHAMISWTQDQRE